METIIEDEDTAGYKYAWHMLAGYGMTFELNFYFALSLCVYGG